MGLSPAFRGCQDVVSPGHVGKGVCESLAPAVAPSDLLPPLAVSPALDHDLYHIRQSRFLVGSLTVPPFKPVGDGPAPTAVRSVR